MHAPRFGTYSLINAETLKTSQSTQKCHLSRSDSDYGMYWTCVEEASGEGDVTLDGEPLAVLLPYLNWFLKLVESLLFDGIPPTTLVALPGGSDSPSVAPDADFLLI